MPSQANSTPPGRTWGRFRLAILDLTERVEAQKACQESDDQLRLALSSADAGSWQFDNATGHALVVGRVPRAPRSTPPEQLREFLRHDPRARLISLDEPADVDGLPRTEVMPQPVRPLALRDSLQHVTEAIDPRGRAAVNGETVPVGRQAPGRSANGTLLREAGGDRFGAGD